MAYDTPGLGSGIVLSAATGTTAAVVLPQIGILPQTGGSNLSVIVVAALAALIVMIISRAVTTAMRLRLKA